MTIYDLRLMDVFYFLLFFVVGGVLTWVIATLLMKSKTVSKKEFEAVTERNTSLNTELIVAQQKLTSKEEDEAELKIEIVRYKEKIENFQNEIQEFERNLSNTAAQLNAAHETIKKQSEDIGSYKLELRSKTDEFNETNKLLAASTADFNALKEKLVVCVG